MDNKSFSLKIGTLVFGKESLSYIFFGFFLVGILIGTFSLVHINHPTISEPIITLLLISGFVIPFILIYKGVLKAVDLSKK